MQNCGGANSVSRTVALLSQWDIDEMMVVIQQLLECIILHAHGQIQSPIEGEKMLEFRLRAEDLVHDAKILL